MPTNYVPTRPVPNQHPGYGYRLTGRKGRRRRVPDLAEQAVMARIVELRPGGSSWEQIALTLLWERVVAKTGREWSISRVRRACLAAVELRASDAALARCPSCGSVESLTNGSGKLCGNCRNAKRRLNRQAAAQKRTISRARDYAALLRYGSQLPRLLELRGIDASQFADNVWATFNALPERRTRPNPLADGNYGLHA